MAYAKKQAHPEFKDRTIFEVFEAERPCLICYREPFDSYRWTSASVSKTCLVRVDTNLYSVQASAVGRPVDVHIYADRIVLRQDGRVVGEHDRSFAHHKRIYDPWHYVLFWRESPAPFAMERPSRTGICLVRLGAFTANSRLSRTVTGRWSIC